METETVVDLFWEGISRGGARGTRPPLPYSYIKLRPEGPKKNVFETTLTPLSQGLDDRHSAPIP